MKSDKFWFRSKKNEQEEMSYEEANCGNMHEKNSTKTQFIDLAFFNKIGIQALACSNL